MRLARELHSCQMAGMVRSNEQHRMQRPWTVAVAVFTAVHHGFELSNGVGLVLQPELGLGGAAALWGSEIPIWVWLAARGDNRWSKLLSVGTGAALGGVLVHFLLWPCRRSRLGVPVLVEAEGLKASSLPPYNAILYIWGAAAVVSIVREVPPGDRRWALAGLAMLPLLRRSARHHFKWLTGEAASNPAWWNRGARV
jgi:hypothetical protein